MIRSMVPRSMTVLNSCQYCNYSYSTPLNLPSDQTSSTHLPVSLVPYLYLSRSSWPLFTARDTSLRRRYDLYMPRSLACPPASIPHLPSQPPGISERTTLSNSRISSKESSSKNPERLLPCSWSFIAEAEQGSYPKSPSHPPVSSNPIPVAEKSSSSLSERGGELALPSRPAEGSVRTRSCVRAQFGEA